MERKALQTHRLDLPAYFGRCVLVGHLLRLWVFALECGIPMFVPSDPPVHSGLYTPTDLARLRLRPTSVRCCRRRVRLERRALQTHTH